MDGPLAQSAVRKAPPPRAAIRYAVEGDLRYLSHRDELRLLARALVRARWPLRYSAGFNPLPRLNVLLPRNVGSASACQLALVELTESRGAAELFGTLKDVLPPACPLLEVTAPASAGTPHPLAAEYELDIAANEAAALAPRIKRMLNVSALPITRSFGPGKPARPYDIRPYIDTIVLDGLVLRLTLRFVQQRTARPSEILAELGLAAEEYAHRIRRTRIHWDLELSGPSVRPDAEERKTLGKTEEGQLPQESTEGH